MLERGRPLGKEELWELDALGDLDGDGRMDFRLRVDTGPGWARPVVASSGWRPIDIAGGSDLRWIAPAPCRRGPAGTSTGTGSGDLVVGRQHPETGERPLSRFSAAGLVDVRTLDREAPGWASLGGSGTRACPAVGRLRPGEAWTILLPLIEEQDWKQRGLVVLLPGS